MPCRLYVRARTGASWPPLTTAPCGCAEFGQCWLAQSKRPNPEIRALR